jgi:hypothetical protein
MGMYEDRGPLTSGRETADLNQGDVLAGVLRPGPATGPSLVRRNLAGSGLIFRKPQTPAAEVLEGETVM